METYKYVDKEGKVLKVFHTTRHGLIRWDHKPEDECVVCKPAIRKEDRYTPPVDND